MKLRIAGLILVLAAFVAAAAAQEHQQQRQAAVQRTHLKVGDPAPEFTLPDNKRQPVTLSSFQGKKNVVLAFYVLAFTGG